MEMDDSEILFGGEYVMLGDIQEPASDEMAAPEPQTKEKVSTAIETAEPEDLITSKQESPMKVEKPKEETKDKDKKKKDKETKDAEKRNNAKAKEINSSVAKGFGTGKGKEGSTNGNSDKGATRGTPGYNLAGRTAESWGRPSSPAEGTVVIRVRVNPKGKVTDATYVSGKGAANASMAVRESCRQASMNSRFSVATNRTTDQMGTITWRFE